ncbi:hypothetical protein H310_02669 [Aphanomyces invadans]|uniref:Uncharacterized protein n=1 Tax=Aphanomyces invadans TaxID=157072 RepID=A0A024UJ19_9STRA|nr:hypothetical protein H310_02669 [Aphanomyces invadans]ETW06396.1 hypothetical protein H310_02669 [Aphanomyces invadans]|eukprot:XP_008864471.1 hypothetical protein H310_02669 [Aphanomyces invadans]
MPSIDVSAKEEHTPAPRFGIASVTAFEVFVALVYTISSRGAVDPRTYFCPLQSRSSVRLNGRHLLLLARSVEARTILNTSTMQRGRVAGLLDIVLLPEWLKRSVLAG